LVVDYISMANNPELSPDLFADLIEKHPSVRWLLILLGEDYAKQGHARLRQKLENELPELQWWSHPKPPSS